MFTTVETISYSLRFRQILMDLDDTAEYFLPTARYSCSFVTLLSSYCLQPNDYTY